MSKLVSNARFWKSSTRRLASIIVPRHGCMGLFVVLAAVLVVI